MDEGFDCSDLVRITPGYNLKPCYKIDGWGTTKWWIFVVFHGHTHGNGVWGHWWFEWFLKSFAHSVIKNFLVNWVYVFSNLLSLLQVVSYIPTISYLFYSPTFADFWGWCTQWLVHFFLDAWDNHQTLLPESLELVLWNHEEYDFSGTPTALNFTTRST